MNRPAMSWCVGVTALAAVSVGAPLRAQEAGAAAVSSASPASGAAAVGSGGSASTQLEEVVVTAEKRSELLSKAPLAISTVNQQNLDELGITSAQQLVTTVPNFQI